MEKYYRHELDLYSLNPVNLPMDCHYGVSLGGVNL